MRRAFLGAAYGPPDGRFVLGAERAAAPAWARGDWAILTAFNPLGRRASGADNAAAGAALETELAGRGIVFRRAVNGEGEWAEPAAVAFGVPLEGALALGRRFRQAAVLWGRGSRVALVWCDGPCVERFWARAVASS